MKKLLAVVLLLTTIGVHAGPNPSVVITIGQWFLKNTSQTFYIQVEARGINDSEARRNGVALAVDKLWAH